MERWWCGNGDLNSPSCKCSPDRDNKERDGLIDGEMVVVVQLLLFIGLLFRMITLHFSWERVLNVSQYDIYNLKLPHVQEVAHSWVTYVIGLKLIILFKYSFHNSSPKSIENKSLWAFLFSWSSSGYIHYCNIVSNVSVKKRFMMRRCLWRRIHGQNVIVHCYFWRQMCLDGHILVKVIDIGYFHSAHFYICFFAVSFFLQVYTRVGSEICHSCPG